MRIEISHFYKKRKKERKEKIKFGARGITNIGIRDVIIERKTFEELNCFKCRS